MKSTLLIHRILLILSTAILLIAGCSESLTETERLAKARESMERGDPRTSIIELKHVLQQNPKNIEARRLLGEVQLETGNGAAAEKELRHAVKLGLAKEAVLLSLAKALQQQGKNQEILDEINPLPSLPPRDQAILAAYRGDAWLALGDTGKAMTEYRRALDLDPQSSRGKLGLAYLAAANDIDDALRLLDEAIAAAPEDGQAWRYKAKLLRHLGKLQQAKAAYSKAITYLPPLNSVEERAQLALIQIELNQFDAAEKEIAALKKIAPDFYLTPFAEGYLDIVRNQIPQAQEPLEQALKLNDTFPPTLFYLGLVHLKQGDLEQAETLLTRAKNLAPGNIASFKMLALVKFHQKDFDAARTLLVPVLLSQPDDIFALKLMADVEQAAHQPQKALQYLQKLVELESSDPAIRIRMGTALLAAGRKEAGLAALEKALAIDPKATRPDITLALAYLRDKNFPEAEKAIARLERKMPNDPLPLNLKAMWHQARGDAAKAESALEKALKFSPGDPVTVENLVRLLIKQDRLDEARQILESALEINPAIPAFQLQLAKLDLARGDFKNMEERLQAVLQSQPDLLEPNLLLAKYYLQFGQPHRAQTLLETIRPRYPDHPLLLSLLAKAQIASKLPHAALNTAKHLTLVDPSSPLGHFLLAQAYSQSGQLRRFRQALDTTLDLDPDFLPARQAKIKLMAMEGKTEEIERELADLAAKYPNDVQVLNLRAWWALHRRQPEQAIGLYEKVLQQHPTSKAARNLAKAVWQAGKREEAIQRLKQWRLKHPRDTGALYLLSLMYQGTKQKDKAHQILTEIVRMAPHHVLALNDLAWLLRQSAPTQALEYAEKAYAAAPEAAWIIDTLGVTLLENGQIKRAARLLEKAAKRAPNNPAIHYHLALARHRLGLDDSALASLKRALAGQQDFAERPEAETLLRTLEP